ncbi:4'-phosphopantetheinyl transferase superfamily protein [Arthrobacter sp. B0490]|uniref:4'-phosphopantetheinyl transferase family protein n=1 Tax=Arthrobacter sp. B0490 TaxID=2058891 RepID=UPI000CE44EA2|nr:4'-phosphopantetheinyl transferase superfamily protein [Arthrobacter sp. B0490]
MTSFPGTPITPAVARTACAGPTGVPTVALRLRAIGPGADLPPVGMMLSRLDDVERARAARARDTAASGSFAAGRYLLRLLVADLLGEGSERLVSDSTCPRCGPAGRPDHGRPSYLLDGERVPLALSLSRAGGFALLGALDLRGVAPTGPAAPGVAPARPPALRIDPAGPRARGGDPAGPPRPGVAPLGAPALGIDLAAASEVDFDGFDGVALTSEEQRAVGLLPFADRGRARARLWTRKEALVKALGTGFTAGDPDAVDVLRDARITDLQAVEGTVLEPLGLVAAVAVAG